MRAIFGESVWGSGKEELADAGGGAPHAPAASGWRWPRAAPAGCWPRCSPRVPGASAVLDLGVVAYANFVKTGAPRRPGAAAGRPRRRLRAGGPGHGRGGPPLPESATWGLGHHRHRRPHRRHAGEAGGDGPPGAGRPAAAPAPWPASTAGTGSGCAAPPPSRRSTCSAGPSTAAPSRGRRRDGGQAASSSGGTGGTGASGPAAAWAAWSRSATRSKASGLARSHSAARSRPWAMRSPSRV